MNPLLVPGRLVLRALDDLHVLARSAQTALPAVEALTRRGDEIVALGARILEIGGQLEGLAAAADRIVDVGRELDRHGAAIVAMGERLDARGEALMEVSDTFRHLGDALVAESQAIQEAANAVVVRSEDIVAALPVLERAVALGEPLEGTVERIGRIVDRLPGGRAHRDEPRRGSRS